MDRIRHFCKRTIHRLGVILIITINIFALTSCAYQPDEGRYTFTVEQQPISQQQEPPDSLTPYGLAEQNKYMAYEVEIADGIMAFVSSNTFTRIELSQALEDGQITPEIILSQVERDAREEICDQEIVCGDHNLTTFVYRYPEYTVAVLNDMFENEREEQYLIRRIFFTNGNENFQHPSLVTLDDEAYIPVDYPDWGVTLEATDITSEGMNLVCRQSGKKPDGVLYLSSIFSVAQKTDTGWEMVEPKNYQIPSYNEAVQAGRTILVGAETEYSVDWRDMVGALSPGTYNLRFYVYLMNEDEGTLTGQKMKVSFTI